MEGCLTTALFLKKRRKNFSMTGTPACKTFFIANVKAQSQLWVPRAQPVAGAVDLSAGVKIKDTKSDASGGEVSHLESG